VYLSENIPYVNIYWEFYRRAHGRDDLVGRDRGLRISDSDWREAAGPAAAIVPGNDASRAALAAAGWMVAAEIHEFYGGPATFFVMARR
jgi:hypothetical protein